MRLEANLSLRSVDSPDPVGVEQNESNLPAYKVELKNINSFRFMEQAVEFEMNRQAEQLDAGETPVQETRGWDSNKNITFSQRTKEDAEDYRYFPDPDIPPIRFTSEQIEEWRTELPELAETVVERWQADHGIEPKYSELLTEDLQTAKQFEAVIKQATTNKESTKIDLNVLANLLVNKKIDADLIGKPSELIKAFAEATATDSIEDSELLPIIESVLAANPDAVDKYKAGKTQVIGFLVGQTMSKLSKKVDAKVLRSKIAESLT
jgi:aspartyl-tRNA(Asn)/glutamyl-tRNA(Gln) amidotransferase subunit B